MAAVFFASLYTKHDRHELYSGADREGEETGHPRLKYNRSLKYVWEHAEIYATDSTYLCAPLRP